ncbi:MAG: hypothetical protein AB7U73_15310 [Pirellulales bacterium]
MAIVIPGTIVGSISGSYELVQQSSFFILQAETSHAYYVLADPDETEDDVITAVGLPQLQSTYLGMWCKSLKPKEITPCRNPFTGAPGVLYEVTATFDNNFSADDENDPDDPTSWRPKGRWYYETEEEAFEHDALDPKKPVQTKAKEKIFASAPRTIAVREIARYETYPFDPDAIFVYGNKLNSVEFYGAPGGTVWLLPMVSDEESIKGQLYERVTYTAKFKMEFDENGQYKPDTWMARFLNQGTQYLPTGDPDEEPKRAVDEQGNPLKINLAANGTKLAGGADPTYVDFNRFGKIDLNALNLGPYS